MKTYTDLKQSKKLAEFLPLESADMHYHHDFDFDELESIPTITEEDGHFVLFPKDIRCWSLAALMEEMNRNGWKISLECCGAEFTAKFDDGETFVMQYADNAIDAFYKMVVALHEKKML